jgi:protein NrfC
MAKVKKGLSRRQFLLGGGAVLVGGVLAAAGCAKEAETVTQTATTTATQTVSSTVETTKTETATATKTVDKTVEVTQEVPSTYAASTGYLVYDTSRCAGCFSCMIACSQAHYGVSSTSLARIQIIRNCFSGGGLYPYDLEQAVCRQCTTPLCVQNCPTGACHVDEANGNVRVIDDELCIGCQTCLSACPFLPHRTVWNPETNKATKCDLCINTPYWDETGGPTGKQACVEICPMGALKLVSEAPSQVDMDAYDVDLLPETPEA